MWCVTDQRSATLTLLPLLDADGAVVALRPSAPVGPMSRPSGVAALGRRRVVVCDSDHDRLVVWDATHHTWHAVPTSSPTGALRSPVSVARTADGRGAYVADATRVLRIADLSLGDGGEAVDVDVAVSGGRRVVALTTTDGGALAVARADGTVGFSDDEGATWSDVQVTGSRIAGLCAFRAGVAAADLARRTVWWVEPGAAPVRLLDEGDGVVLPAAVARAPGAAQELVVCDAGRNRLRRHVFVGGVAVAAEYINGRRPDGSFRFDRVAGLASGALAEGGP